MTNMLGKLENNEAVLMMYLAGELAQEERVEVDELLQRDPALRAQLTAMRRLMDRVGDGFAMDVAVDEQGATQRVGDRLSPVFAQWAVQRLVPRDAVAAGPTGRTPWFIYPLGAVAVILVGLAVFWSSLEPEYAEAPAPQLAYLPDWGEVGTETSEASEPPTPDQTREAECLIATFDDGQQLVGDGAASLAGVAVELGQIRDLAAQMDTELPTTWQ